MLKTDNVKENLPENDEKVENNSPSSDKLGNYSPKVISEAPAVAPKYQFTLYKSSAKDKPEHKKPSGTASMTWRDLIAVSQTPEIRDYKDGRCWLPGTLNNTNDAVDGFMQPFTSRKDANAATIHVLYFDVDGTQTLDEVEQLLRKSGLPCILTTTFTHMQDTTEVHMKSFSDWCERRDLDPNSDETIRVYADHIGVKLTSIDRTAQEFTLDLDALTKPRSVTLHHEPLHKMRIAVQITEPFTFDGTQERADLWRGHVLFQASRIGLKIDTSGQNPARIFYAPATHPDRRGEYICKVVEGAPLDLSAYDAEAKAYFAEHGKQRNNANSVTRDKQDGDIPERVKDSEGVERDFDRWFNAVRSDLLLATFYETHAKDEVVRPRDNVGRVHIVCPNTALHSKPGVIDGATFVSDPSEHNHGYSVCECQHHHCRDISLKRMVWLMIVNKTATFAQLDACTTRALVRTELNKRLDDAKVTAPSSDEIESIIYDTLKKQRLSEQPATMNRLRDIIGYTVKQFDPIVEQQRAQLKKDSKKKQPTEDDETAKLPVAETLPFPYVYDEDDGSIGIETDEVDEVTGEPVIKKLCSHMKFGSLVRDANNTGEMQEIFVTNIDGVVTTVKILRKDLLEKPLAPLVDAGLRIYGTSKIGAIISLLHLVEPDGRKRSVERAGWHGNVFALPDSGGLKTYGATDEQLTLVGTIDPKFAAQGTLEEWHEHIGRYARGNSRVIFSMAVGFAPVLMDRCNVEGGIFHFVGESSKGKTVLLEVAGSVWGGAAQKKHEYVASWNTTGNAIETTLQQHNNALLCLDEIGQAGADEVKKIAYTVTNSHGKVRSQRDGLSNQQSKAWSLLVLSSGEHSFGTKIKESRGSTKTTGGQAVRFIDLPAIAGTQGVFEDTHGMRPGEFAQMFKHNTKRFYGTPIRGYLEWMFSPDIGVESATEAAKKTIQAFVTDVVPAGADGQIGRVASRFGLVAASGELAIKAGVLPLEEGDAYKATKQMFALWLAERGTIGSQEIASGVEAVFEKIRRNGSRFQDKTNSSEKVHDRLGFYEDVAKNDYREYFIADEDWPSFCEGYDPVGVAKELKERGILQTEGRALLKRVRIPGVGRGAYRVLRIVGGYADENEEITKRVDNAGMLDHMRPADTHVARE